MIAKKGGHKVGLGVGIVTAAALAGAMGYYLYGKHGAKNRKKVKSLAHKVHQEVLVRAQKLKTIGKGDYHKIVDMVTKKYSAVKSIDKKEIKKVALGLKKHWKNIEREALMRAKKISKGKRKQ